MMWPNPMIRAKSKHRAHVNHIFKFNRGKRGGGGGVRHGDRAKGRGPGRGRFTYGGGTREGQP